MQKSIYTKITMKEDDPYNPKTFIHSPTPLRRSASSLSSQDGNDEIFIFKTILTAKENVRYEIPPNERKYFQSLFKQLEDAIKKGTIASSKDAVSAIRRLEMILVRSRGKKHIDNLFKMIKKLSKALESGSNQGNAFKFVKMDSSENLSTKDEAAEFETRDNNRPLSSRPAEGASAVVVKEQGSNTATTDKKADKKLLDEMKETKENLVNLVEELLEKHTELIGNVQGVISEKRDSPAALVSDLRNLFSSFTKEIEQNKFKAKTSDIKQVSAGRKLNTVVNQWLMALKTDIEKGQCTTSFEGDTRNELTTTKELLQDIAQSLTNNWKKEHKLREDLKSQQHDTEKRIFTIWKLTVSGKKTSPEPNSSDALTELEKFIIETKQSSEKQKQEEASLDAELEKLEKEIEDLSQQTTKQKEKADIPSQRVKYISQTINKWKNEVQERRSQNNASDIQRMHEMGSDDATSNVTDVCAFCATHGKLNPALYYCKDCSTFGRYICGICKRNHDMFLSNHNAARLPLT